MPSGAVLFSTRRAEPILRMIGILVQKKKNFCIVLPPRDTGTALPAEAEGVISRIPSGYAPLSRYRRFGMMNPVKGKRIHGMIVFFQKKQELEFFRYHVVKRG
jgi:hypothetical protein